MTFLLAIFKLSGDGLLLCAPQSQIVKDAAPVWNAMSTEQCKKYEALADGERLLRQHGQSCSH